jgi:hypothetical protein
MRAFCIGVVGTLLAGTAWAFPEGCNPFPADARPELFELRTLYSGSMLQIGDQEGRAVTFRVVVDGKEHNLRLRIEGHNELRMDLDADGAQQISDMSLGDAGWALFRLYAGDLNRDGIDDFVIDSWGGGCGRAASLANICFVLSTGEGYQATETATYYGREENFVVLDGRPCFVNVMEAVEGPCKDGFVHWFFVFNILTFDKGEVRVGNTLHPGFPMIQLDHNEIQSDPKAFDWKDPVGSETTLLKDERKQQLQQDAVEELFKRKSE